MNFLYKREEVIYKKDKKEMKLNMDYSFEQSHLG